MGRIVFAGAMSHVLDPDYYERACGSVGRQKVEAAMAEIARMGERCSAKNPDALIVVADDHLNAFSFNAVPAICVRRSISANERRSTAGCSITCPSVTRSTRRSPTGSWRWGSSPAST